MEDVQRKIAVSHALDKTGDGGLVIIGGERGGQPQAKRPGGRQGRAAGERGVAREDFLGSRAVDEEILQHFARHAELYALDFFRGHLQRYPLGMIDKHSIAAIGEIKGDILIGLLTAGAAVFIPQIDHLAVFDKGGEALSQPVDTFAHTQSQLLVDVTPLGEYRQNPSRASRCW